MSTTLTLIGKPGCHLCDDARGIVHTVLTEFSDVRYEERSILDDPELNAAYAEEIPVVLINDKVHNIWRVNPDRLRTALEEASA
ncbi:glutaredoxin family protein [Salinibacterium sp. ZJ450]|uniref:glutaredoxin family protein n=1 Tax=Salinibacterium sp. ZJ450 TaxID=2708338 RepID=UPI0014249B37|nr:glutaredoxin family protein [Salinibacterium sp. ZJ450]